MTMTGHWRLDDAARAAATDRRYATIDSPVGSELGLYAPRGSDPQAPHDRDEYYVVARGDGQFVRDGEVMTFGAGDALFVPAGMAHRFQSFSDDLLLWVVFVGDRS